MKNIFKWIFIAGGAFVVIIVAAVLIIPQFVDVKKYKPMIEERVSQATGRSFTIGDEMDISVFPWVGVSLTDIHLGNPAGAAQADMVSVKNFEVRLKVMPLLSRQIEVKTFVLDSPVIYLERQKDGKANWEGIGAQKQARPEQKKDPAPSSGQELPVASLKVDRFSIANGQLIYNDLAAGMKKQVSEVNLDLSDISLDKPVTISFSANADGQPVSLKGTAGPIGKQPGKGTLSFDLVLNALSDLEAKVNGSVVDPAVKPVFDLNIDVASFSPRNLMSALGQPFPIETSDPKVLDAVAVRARIKGTPENVSVLDGLLTLDDSKLNFSAQAKEFGKPNLAFNLALDTIDLDRYLPLPAETKDAGAPAAEPAAEKKKTDYGPLRKLILDGKMTADKVKARGALAENITVHIKAKDGLISVDPMGMDLYQGNATAVVGLDVRKTEPQTSLSLNAEGIQVGPLLKDALQKELIEGMLRADLNLSVTGESLDRIKQTLNGKGGLVFNDGAIIGIDLAGMVRNVKAKLGAAVPTGEKPRTDFAELNIPFTAVNGLVNTNVTRMQSPLIRLEASGDINLAKDLLDMRVDPKFVATLKGQGDTEDRSGLMVPLLVTGTFASPKIRPDLKGMVGLGEKGLDADTLKKQVLGSGSPADVKKELETKKEEIKDQVKGLIPGLLN